MNKIKVNLFGLLFLLSFSVSVSAENSSTLFDEYKKKADLGKKDAYPIVAHMYEKAFSGVSVPNYEKAFYYYNLASESGDTKSQFIVAKSYITGDWYNIEVEQNYNESLRLLKICASKNYQNCIDFLAKIEKFDSNAINEKLNILKNYRIEANNGNTRTQFNLGKIYYDGEFMPSDYTKAISLFSNVFQNDLELRDLAAYYIAQSLLKGGSHHRSSSMKDHDDAIKYYLNIVIQSKSVMTKQFQDIARIQLAKFYYSNMPTKEDSRYYGMLAHTAAMNGNKEALEFLGKQIQSITLDYYKNYTKEEKEKFIMMSAMGEDGTIESQYYMGNKNKDNPYEASKWYLLCANKGYTLCEYEIWRLYESGNKIIESVNRKKAFDFLIAAADKKYYPAQLNLTMEYITGNYLERNLEKAQKIINSNISSSSGEFYLINLIMMNEKPLFSLVKNDNNYYKLRKNPAYDGGKVPVGYMYNPLFNYIIALRYSDNSYEASKWFLFCANQGNYNCKYQLWKLYSNDKPLVEEINLYEKISLSLLGIKYKITNLFFKIGISLFHK